MLFMQTLSGGHEAGLPRQGRGPGRLRPGPRPLFRPARLGASLA